MINYNNTINVISDFRGKYYFLSNFYSAPVEYDGFVYSNNEAAFQSAKCIVHQDRRRFTNLPPNVAKALGRRIRLRADWEQIKDQTMYQIVKNKFLQNTDLANRLLQTESATLIEGNTWGDNYWGISPYNGPRSETSTNNHLGKILMKVRYELKNRK